MQACPHCQQKTITNWAKLWSVTVNPVRCSACCKYSFLHAVHALKGLVFWIAISWLFIALTWFSQQVFLLLGTFPAMFYAVNHFMLGAPMRPLFPDIPKSS